MVASDEGSARSGQRKNAVLGGGENTVVLTVRLVNSLFTVIWETFLFR